VWLYGLYGLLHLASFEFISHWMQTFADFLSMASQFRGLSFLNIPLTHCGFF